jgi:hypothetical protein
MPPFEPTHRFVAIVTAGDVGTLYRAKAIGDATMITSVIAGKGALMPI